MPNPRNDPRVDATVILVNVVGWIGMALLISAYALVTTGRILGPSLTFQLMNLVGGGSLMVNSAYYAAWPSAALNLVWVVIGVVGLARARLKAAGVVAVEEGESPSTR